MDTLFRSPPLKDFLLLKTHDVEKVHERVAEIFCAHRVQASTLGSSSGEAILHHAPFPNSSFNYLAYRNNIKIDVAQLGFFLIEIPLAGASETHCGDGTVLSGPGQAVIAGPYRQFSTEWTEDCTKLLIKIDNHAFENYLSTLLGRKQIRALDFQMGLTLNSKTGSAFLRTVEFIVNGLDDPHSLINMNPLARLQHERMLMWTLLYCQPNNYSEEINNLDPPTAPHYVLQTENYMYKHYSDPITLDELVEFSNVSERTLFEGFRRHRDVSPMKYLKFTRFEKAHLALLEANRATNNVTDIALSCGFSQLGKFAVEYKERFGESPSDTLKTEPLNPLS